MKEVQYDDEANNVEQNEIFIKEVKGKKITWGMNSMFYIVPEGVGAGDYILGKGYIKDGDQRWPLLDDSYKTSSGWYHYE